jgi:hypothetical protein
MRPCHKHATSLLSKLAAIADLAKTGWFSGEEISTLLLSAVDHEDHRIRMLSLPKLASLSHLRAGNVSNR